MRFRQTRSVTGACLLGLVLAALAVVPGDVRAQPRFVPGDPLPRIQCPPGYTARVYAQGLHSPDGLAISPSGLLYVAEETAGRVSRIDAAGGVTPVLTGLDHPEGIAFDPQTGALVVVEDVENGRLVERAADGTVTALAHGLEAPEGVTWAPDGTLYLTESNLQFASPANLRSRVAAVEGETITRVITDTPAFAGTQVRAQSYAGIAPGPDGRLYVTNELSGQEITRTVLGIPFVLTTTDSIFVVDPAAGTHELFAGGLTAPEGLAWSPGGGFPLYVAEEDLGDGHGRISTVDAGGQHAPFCTGFLTIEDVAVNGAADGEGTLYVSEDGSGTVIVIERDPVEPDLVAEFAGTPRAGIVPLRVVFSNTSGGSYQTRVWDLGDGQVSILEHPIHTYQAPGSYTVTLTIVGPESSDTETKADYITVYWGLYLPLMLRP